MARTKMVGRPAKPAPAKPAKPPTSKEEAKAVAKRLASLGKSLSRCCKKTVHTTDTHKPFTTYAEGASRAEAEALLSTCGGVEKTNSSRFLTYELSGEQLVNWLGMEHELGPTQHKFTGFGGRIPVSFLHLYVRPESAVVMHDSSKSTLQFKVRTHFLYYQYNREIPGGGGRALSPTKRCR